MNLNKIQSIHFIGIGGYWDVGFGAVFLHEKKIVSESDRTASAFTDALVNEGVQFLREAWPPSKNKRVYYIDYVTPFAIRIR